MEEYEDPRSRGLVWGLVAIAAAVIIIATAAITYAIVGGDNGTDADGTPTPTPTAPATPTEEPTETPTPTPEPTPTDTPTPTPTPTPTATPSPPPASTDPARVIDRGPTDRRAVTLTFDAGSDTGFTQDILDTLEDNGITAAFGLTGQWAERNPQLVQAIADAGHEFINHSYDHDSFTGFSTGAGPQSQEERWQQLDRTEEIIFGLTGQSTLPYFRPPYGDYDASVNRDVGLRGYQYNVMWTVDSRGWQGISAQEIAARCLDLAEPGAIYIFHVGSASQDAAALQDIIDGLRDDGYDFVPLAEMIP